MKNPLPSNPWLFRRDWSTLRRIGQSFGRVLLLSPADDSIAYKKILCLAIEKGELAVAVGSRFLSRIKITGFKKYPTPESSYPPPNFLISSLALALAELETGRADIGLILPKAWAVIKTIEYPSSVLENLSNVISYELDRITPFTPEAAYYDFKILKEEKGKVSLLIAAARGDLVDPYLKALKENGFKVGSITIDLLGAGTLCRYLNKKSPFFFVGLDEHQYQGALFLSDEDPRFFSGIFSDGDEMKRIARINEEVESLAGLSGQRESLGEAVFYSKDKNPSIEEGIKLRLGRPVTWLDESDPGLKSFNWEQKQVSYTAIGGILESLWNKSWGLNLIRKGVHPRFRPPWVLSLLILLSFVFLLGFYWRSPLEIEKRRLSDIEKLMASKKIEVKKVEGLKKEVDTLVREMTLITDFKQSKPLCLDILKALTVVLPRNSWLTRVRVSDNHVNIEGYSPSATLLIPKLEESNYFQKVEFSAPTFRDPRQNSDRFQIKMEIEKR